MFYDDFPGDKAILQSVLQARVEQAKEKDKEKVVENALLEWHANKYWFSSEVTGRGSFLWFCDQLGLDPAAVREAISE